jgi:hypothetical protein
MLGNGSGPLFPPLLGSAPDNPSYLVPPHCIIVSAVVPLFIVYICSAVCERRKTLTALSPTQLLR